MEELTPKQREHWEKVLSDSERAVKIAKKVLGILEEQE